MNYLAATELKQISVLYVENEESLCEEISHYLKRRVGELFVASDGAEGLAAFKRHKPDIVVSDIEMPVMDGFSMAEAIKSQSPATPVILATAFNDVRYLHRAIELGIDGYVLKPIDLKLLSNAIVKSAALLLKTRELITSRAQLEAYHKAAEEERHLVAALMERMMHPERLRDEQLRYLLKPTDVVSGDLIAISRARNEVLYFMLADSTGHGLPATLNLLPINHIFYSMVNKCLPISLIVEEMNWAVKEQSPADRYVAAIIAAVDNRNRQIEVWNGGIPPALFVDTEGEVLRTFNSVNLPLGVLDRTFTAHTDIFQWSAPGQIVVYSDGFEEAENERGEALGAERIKAAMRNIPPAERFDRLNKTLEAHTGNRNAFDDMTLMMIECESGSKRA
jgi:two-component system, HptB-dependent secretion and biofilm response regulator